MEAAHRIVEEKGAHDGLIGEIAGAVGIVEGTIYRYFPTKRDLLIAVAESWYEAILSDYDQQLKGIRGTRNRLRFMIWRHLKVMHDAPAMCRFLLGEVRAGADYRRTSVFELNRRYTQRTLAIIKEGVASGEFRADVPLAVVRDMIYGGVEHHTWSYLRGEGEFSPDRAADAIVAIICRGLAPEPADAVAPLARLDAVADRFEDLLGQWKGLDPKNSNAKPC